MDLGTGEGYAEPSRQAIYPWLMTDRRSMPDDRPNVGSVPLEAEIQALQGEELPADQDAVLSLDEVEDEEERSYSDYEAGAPVNPDLRAGETDDALVAIEEGLVWVPPTDPPIAPSDDADGIDVPGSDEQDEGESDINARIREALRADSSTSALADRVRIAVIGSTAILRGRVDGLEDGDALVDVASGVEGIEDVRDETEVAGLD
jgi:hypothetical protein